MPETYIVVIGIMLEFCTIGLIVQYMYAQYKQWKRIKKKSRRQ